MNNPEDQNPLLPNLRDECLSGMNSVVKGIFIGFAICVAAVIAWFFFLVTRPAKVQPKFEDMPILWTNGVERFDPFDPPIDRSGRTNVFYVLGRTYRSFGVETDWTNVVFSSTREPVVTKTNGEWRIGFK